METDRENNANLQKYCDYSGWKYSEKVKYQTDLIRRSNKKSHIMIIDESD